MSDVDNNILYERIRRNIEKADGPTKETYAQIIEKLNKAKEEVTTGMNLQMVMTSAYTPVLTTGKPKKGINRRDARNQERMLKALNAKCADLVKSYFTYCDRTMDPNNRELAANLQMEFLMKLNRSWINWLVKEKYNIDNCRNMLNQKCFEMINLHEQVRIKEQKLKNNKTDEQDNNAIA